METAIYCRVSTEEQAQEGFSIRAQEQKLKEYANVKDWSIYNIYLDEGISGKNITERPAINRMIADIKTGRVKNVLVFKLDRLTRSVADLVSLMDIFNESGCAFNSLMESLDTSTASGRMFIKIIGIFAEFERENIAERSRVGFERKAREGYSGGAKFSSYGYEREKGQKVQTINEHEAENVRMIFDMFVNQGMSYNAIAKSLNLRDIPTKGNSYWTAASVRGVLNNCNYIGNVRYCMHEPNRNFETEGLHEAIISEELYNEAKAIIEKNKRISPTKKPNEHNYLTGFLYCDKCGERFNPHRNITQYKGTPYKTDSFMCKKRMLKGCNAKSATAQKIEKALILYFERIDDLSVADRVNIEEKQQQARQNAGEQINILTEKIKKMNSREREIMQFYTSGDIEFDNYRAMKQQIDNDRDFINTEISKLKAVLGESEETKISRADIVTNFRENWSNLTDPEKRQFLTNFIKKIHVLNEPIEGTFRGNTIVTDVEFCEE
jgi:site-specific DNA recombinase